MMIVLPFLSDDPSIRIDNEAKEERIKTTDEIGEDLMFRYIFFFFFGKIVRETMNEN